MGKGSNEATEGQSTGGRAIHKDQRKGKAKAEDGQGMGQRKGQGLSQRQGRIWGRGTSLGLQVAGGQARSWEGGFNCIEARCEAEMGQLAW